MFEFFSQKWFLKYLNKCAHGIGRKSLSNPADIYLSLRSTMETPELLCVKSIQSSEAYLQPSWKF